MTTVQFLSVLINICLEIVDTNVFWLLFKIIKSCTYSLNLLQGFLSCLHFVLEDNQVNEMCRCCVIENIKLPPCSVGWSKMRCTYDRSECVCVASLCDQLNIFWSKWGTGKKMSMTGLPAKYNRREINTYIYLFLKQVCKNRLERSFKSVV